MLPALLRPNPADHGPQRERRAFGVAGVLPLHAGSRHLLPQGVAEWGRHGWEQLQSACCCCLAAAVFTGAADAASAVCACPCGNMRTVQQLQEVAGIPTPGCLCLPCLCVQADICQLGMDQRKVGRPRAGPGASMRSFAHDDPCCPWDVCSDLRLPLGLPTAAAPHATRLGRRLHIPT